MLSFATSAALVSSSLAASSAKTISRRRGEFVWYLASALLAAGIGVGVSSSVIPYVTDQLAMARLSRAAFSLMLALLPVFATVIGAIVLRQLPTVQDVAGITLVVLGVALHREQPQREE